MFFKRFCLFATTLVSSVGSLPADDVIQTNTPSAEPLPEVIITATQTEDVAQDLPFVVDTISAEELQYRLPRTVPEALRETPAVMVQKTGHGQGSPFIRGFTGFRTLLLIDGVRLNNSVFREGPNQYWNTVDPLSIRQLEVVKGPGSVLYGSDAIGGTVNALTIRRQDFGTGFDWDRRVFYRVSSAENSHIGRGEISGNLDEQLGFVGGISYKQFGDLRGGGDVGKQRYTGYGELDWDAKLEYLLSPATKLVLAHQTVDQEDAWRTHRTIYGVRWEGTSRGDDKVLSYDQRRDLTYIQLHSVERDGFIEEIHASVSHHLQQEDEFRVRTDDRTDRKGFDVNTFGLSFNLQSPTPIGRFVYGAEYYRDWVSSYSKRYNLDGSVRSTEIQGPVADDATYDLLGIFVQDTFEIGDRFEGIIGGRFNYSAVDARSVSDPTTGARTSLSDDWNALVGSARGLYRLDEAGKWNAFAGISQGFRAPNLSDLTRFDIAASGEQEVPSLNVEPEHFVTYEIGLKTDFERWTSQIAYFYTDISDMIVRTPTGNFIGANREVVKFNAGDGHVHGFEVHGEVKLHEQLTGRMAFTWMEGELETYPATSSIPVKQTEPLSRTMPTTLQVGLLWEHPSRKYWAEAVGTFAARQDRLASADVRDTQRIPPGGTPGYSVYTIRAGWRPVKNLTFAAAIENLTDEDYRIHGSGLNEPGRNFILSADFRF